MVDINMPGRPDIKTKTTRSLVFNNQRLLPAEGMNDNIRVNMARGLPVLDAKVKVHDRTLVIIGTAPSIKSRVPRIRRMAKDHDAMAVNAAHDWCVENKVPLKYAAAMDGKYDFNDMFNHAQENIQYLLASMANPAVFDKLTGRNILVWHSDEFDQDETLLGPNPLKIGGGSQIGLRALSLGYILGYRQFRLFGIEASDIGGRLYVDSDREADKKRISVEYAGKEFTGIPDVLFQADGFEAIMRKTHGHCDILAYGDGLIPYMSRVLRKELSKG